MAVYQRVLKYLFLFIELLIEILPDTCNYIRVRFNVINVSTVAIIQFIKQFSYILISFQPTEMHRVFRKIFAKFYISQYL